MFLQLLVQHPDKPMSGIYGGIHLLRLFGKLLNQFHYLCTRGKQPTVIVFGFNKVYHVFVFLNQCAILCIFCASFPVKLGKNLAYTPLDDKSIQLLLMQIQDFLR